MNEANWPYKPNMVQIETVQGCNRRCKFCGTMGIERAFHFAEIETVQHTCKLIRQAGLYCWLGTGSQHCTRSSRSSYEQYGRFCRGI
mgnify:CR=1 FL=1